MIVRETRPISWIKAAQKDFEEFPEEAQMEILRALTIAAEGQKADIAKPMKGQGSGVFEVALAWRGDAYRTVYAVQLGRVTSGLCMRSRRSPRQASKRRSRRLTLLSNDSND